MWVKNETHTVEPFERTAETNRLYFCCFWIIEECLHVKSAFSCVAGELVKIPINLEFRDTSVSVLIGCGNDPALKAAKSLIHNKLLYLRGDFE